MRYVLTTMDSQQSSVKLTSHFILMTAVIEARIRLKLNPDMYLVIIDSRTGRVADYVI